MFCLPAAFEKGMHRLSQTLYRLGQATGIRANVQTVICLQN